VIASDKADKRFLIPNPESTYATGKRFNFDVTENTSKSKINKQNQ